MICKRLKISLTLAYSLFYSPGLFVARKSISLPSKRNPLLAEAQNALSPEEVQALPRSKSSIFPPSLETCLSEAEARLKILFSSRIPEPYGEPWRDAWRRMEVAARTNRERGEVYRLSLERFETLLQNTPERALCALASLESLLNARLAISQGNPVSAWVALIDCNYELGRASSQITAQEGAQKNGAGSHLEAISDYTLRLLKEMPSNSFRSKVDIYRALESKLESFSDLALDRDSATLARFKSGIPKDVPEFLKRRSLSDHAHSIEYERILLAGRPSRKRR